MMSVDGKIDVRCSIEDAWDLFCRFGDVAELIPTVTDIEIDGDEVNARVEVKLGALPVSSRIYLEVTERKPLQCLKARGLSYLGETLTEQMKKSIDGVDAGSAGRIMMHLDLRPSEAADHIAVIYHAEVEAEGRLKRIYEAILKTKVPALMEEFADNIRSALETAEPRAAETPQETPVAMPDETAASPVPDVEPRSPTRPAEMPPPSLLARLFDWLREVVDWLRELLEPARVPA